MVSRSVTKLLAALATGTGMLCVGCVLVVVAAIGGGASERAGAKAGADCAIDAGSGSGAWPKALEPIYDRASARYDLGPKGWAVLASINQVETAFGRNMAVSSAGALGWMQFMPGTWRAYGVDANGDGKKDPKDPHDAIHAAANYLHASGAPGDWPKAVFAYNHAWWYVDKVLKGAEKFFAQRASKPAGPASSGPAITLAASGCAPPVAVEADARGVRRITGGGGIVAIPGFPGESIDSRLLNDVAYLVRAYRIRVTDGYSTDPVHTSKGEHPLGLALDIVPGPGGSWDDIDRLAAWAEPKQKQPRAPFRWVGYNGDPDHGRGHHLHLSWNHAPGGPPSAWVDVLAIPLTQ